MDKRSETLDALSAYIAAQTALLARTRGDLERLKQLRKDQDGNVLNDEAILSQLSAVSSLHTLTAVSESPIKGVDWSLYADCDPSPLRDLTASANFAHARHAEPSATQTTPHSPLQLLVKGARKTIIDPVFAALDLPYDPPPLPIDAAAEEAANRAREHVKIIELKKRKLAGGARGGGLTIRRRDVDGVFLRQDLEDESGDVDVDASAKPPASMAGVTSAVASGAIDIPTAGPSDLSMGVARTRRPSKKVQQEADVLSSNNKPGRSKKVTIIKQVSGSMPASLHTSEETLVTLGPDSELPSTALDAKGKKIKPKSDTFKLAWSIEEQHLLERLLKEHPEGSKNRWLQISRAMGGRRTPRQVASRVQKYFEKLRRFGLEAESGEKIDPEDDDGEG